MKKYELKTLLTDVKILRYEKILQSYVQPSFSNREKNYHSYKYHILRMRVDFVEYFSQICFSEYEVLVLLAVIYFHDVVYNVTSNSNEKDSAIIFEQFLVSNEQIAQFINDDKNNLNDFKNDVCEIILSTKISALISVESNPLIKIIHDLDYASFADFLRLENDAKLIMYESGLSEKEFALRRCEFLECLVNKEIFYTSEMVKYNKLAQENITKCIENSSEVNMIIEKLELEPLTIEGGFFSEIFRSNIKVDSHNRTYGTSIYYLLKANEISKWHKVASDEIWYYHAGISVVQLLIFADGHLEKRVIGGNVVIGEVPQSFIPAGTWQAAMLISNEINDFGLFGAAVFPSFEYSDFTDATMHEIYELFPIHMEKIKEIFDEN